ncbi:MAG: DegT/DnrJ/EryC1/StrS family aminotransferase [Dysgonamonadaceae bacterium]|jgi:perosamine synthetase|nr:DegT/DnrJ/EryC1/StrS family aminotransferase [Dysgonamonadaceae bacterium]
MERISNLERQYVEEVLNNGFATSLNSIFNNKLEQTFADAFHAKYAIGHCNGTATLHTALAALGIKPDDEVIVPPLTMSSTALAVLHNHSVPVFADVDKDTFNISPEAIEKVITPKTKAIITVALYGLPPDYDEILSICNAHKIFLIEDNAECFLGEYKGKLVGEFGHFSSYSFQASKHLTAGEGGMLICNDEDLADRARRFNCLGYAGVNAKQGKITRQDIQSPNYARHISLGFNYRMSELQAAVAFAQLERIEELVAQRIKVAKIFDEVVCSTDLLKRQMEPEGYKNSYWSYSVTLETDRPETDWFRLRDLFQKNGGDGYYAAWMLSYDEPLFRNEVQQKNGVWQIYEKGLCPVAESLQKRMIQFKTNYWNLEEAEKQADILQQTIQKF